MSDDGARPVDVRVLAEGNVGALIACIRSCYGDSYTEPEFYDSSYLRAELRAQRLFSVAAMVGPRVVGQLGTRMASSGDGIADTIAGVVDPDYRGLGRTRRMGTRMVAEYRQLGIVGTRNVATGAHDRTQRLLVAAGAVATGVLLGHIRAGTDYRGLAHGFGDARIGAVVYFQAYAPLAPLDVHLPGRFIEPVRELYQQLGIERRIVPHPRRPSPPGAESLIGLAGSADHDERRRLSTVRFGSLAPTATIPAIELIHRTVPHAQPVTYGDVPIADSRAPAVLDLLSHSGFCFGALLPGTATSEAIRMQRLAGTRPAPDQIATASPGGRALLEWITNDYRLTY
jgi:GNAT superfamily N-acetyltransferase